MSTSDELQENYDAGYRAGVNDCCVEGDPAILARLAELDEAIRSHRDQKADDRCWLDDQTLYAVLGDGNLGDNRVGDPAAMLENCKRFIDRRCTGGEWPTYADLARQLAAMSEENASLRDAAQDCYVCRRKVLGAQNTLQPPSQTGWQPIETAPNDVRVLVIEGDRIRVSYAVNGWWGTEGAYTKRIHPTHWMPMPQPPATVMVEESR